MMKPRRKARSLSFRLLARPQNLVTLRHRAFLSQRVLTLCPQAQDGGLKPLRPAARVIEPV